MWQKMLQVGSGGGVLPDNVTKYEKHSEVTSGNKNVSYTFKDITPKIVIIGANDNAHVTVYSCDTSKVIAKSSSGVTPTVSSDKLTFTWASGHSGSYTDFIIGYEDNLLDGY